MYARKILAYPRFAARRKLSARERRLVCRLIAVDPESLGRIKGDPRLGGVARRLMDAYREEMLADLCRRLEAKGANPDLAKSWGQPSGRG
jgi:hypothetical protein